MGKTPTGRVYTTIEIDYTDDIVIMIKYLSDGKYEGNVVSKSGKPVEQLSLSSVTKCMIDYSKTLKDEELVELISNVAVGYAVRHKADDNSSTSNINLN